MSGIRAHVSEWVLLRASVSPSYSLLITIHTASPSLSLNDVSLTCSFPWRASTLLASLTFWVLNCHFGFTVTTSRTVRSCVQKLRSAAHDPAAHAFLWHFGASCYDPIPLAFCTLAKTSIVWMTSRSAASAACTWACLNHGCNDLSALSLYWKTNLCKSEYRMYPRILLRNDSALQNISETVLHFCISKLWWWWCWQFLRHPWCIFPVSPMWHTWLLYWG